MARPDLHTPRGGGAYTVFVRLLKFTLPLAALVIVGIVFARMTENPVQQQLDYAAAEKEKTEAGQIEVTGAQYEGADENGNPYTLIARSASRITGTEDSVRLDGLKADAVLQDKSWISATAATGAYTVGTQKLVLAGGVRIYHDSGYEGRLDNVAIDLKEKKAETQKPVHLRGPLGEIDAAGLETFDEGARLVFAGPVRIKLYRLGRDG